MTEYYGQYAKLWVSVDCIVFGFEENHLKLLIGKRKMNPGRGQLSLYGGFVGTTESLTEAASRVLYDLTGMRELCMRQVGAYGAIDRDPGERVISIAYYALINVADYDDSLRKLHDLEWVNIDEVPQLYSDHNKMVSDALTKIRKSINTEPIGFRLLPELFTLTQLQHLYEAVLDEQIDKRNFRKRIKQMNYIEKTDKVDRVMSKRAAALYRFNEKIYNDDPSFNL